MTKVSAAKKTRDKKKLDKLALKKQKADKMRNVLASLSVISKPGEKSSIGGKANETEYSSGAVIQEAQRASIYKEMKSFKTMKRKWKDSASSRTLKP